MKPMLTAEGRGQRTIQVSDPRRRLSWAPRLAPLLLVGLVVILLWRPLLGLAVLAPVDMLFESPAYADQRPTDFHYASNPLLGDQTYQFIPWRSFVHSELRAGRLPLWN